MINDFILAIDVGSQSVRASLVDREGNFAAVRAVPVPATQAPAPGFAEADASEFFDCVAAACQSLHATTSDAFRRVAGVTLTTQRGTMVFIGHDEQPVRPAILWSDQRRSRAVAPVGGLMGLGIALSGARNTVRHLRSRAPALWLAQNEPETLRATQRVVLLSSYLIFRLTGRWVDSSAAQVGYLPFHFRQQRWLKPSNWRWRALGLQPHHQLVDLVAPGAPLGVLTADGARAVALEPAVPVIAAAADKACEVLGSGCTRGAMAALSYGTAATVNLVHQDYRTVRRFLPAYPAALSGHYVSEVQVHHGFALVSWFLREFGQDLVHQAQTDQVAPEQALNAFLGNTEPGVDNLVTQSAVTHDVRLPDETARSAIREVLQTYPRAHVYRALIEGLILELREALEYLERRQSLTVREIHVAGGGAHSDPIMQMTADVFGRPALRPPQREASSLGAAMCAAAGLGWYPDVAQAALGMTQTARVFQPRAEHQKIYARLARQIEQPPFAWLSPHAKNLA